jgi:hypothetical protein
MTSEWRSGRGVSERDGRSDQPRERRGQFTSVAEMTAVEVLGRVDELTDGTVRSVDAATGAGIGPYWKSRVNCQTSRLYSTTF